MQKGILQKRRIRFKGDTAGGASRKENAPWQRASCKNAVPMLFLDGHNKQMVCPTDLCHQWCHKFIVLVGFLELLHTVETATIETFDAGVLLRNVCGNFVNDLIAKA